MSLLCCLWELLAAMVTVSVGLSARTPVDNDAMMLEISLFGIMPILGELLGCLCHDAPC